MNENPQKLLLVDDDTELASMLHEFLELQGFSVDCTDSGEAALQHIEAQPPDLVVLDVMLPGINGFELTQRIRANDRTKETPVVVVTSLSSDEDKRKGIEVGAQAYIVKGTFDQTTLLETIGSLIG